jgi:hypothetical protein
MQRLKEVADATALMQMAAEQWSVLRWIAEKKKVRKAADVANAALDETNRTVKAMWSPELKAAYASLIGENGKQAADSLAPELKAFVQQMKQADDEAYRARMEAEDTFAVAEKRLSTSMAREGARQAVISWEAHEKAIDLAEAGTRLANTVS